MKAATEGQTHLGYTWRFQSTPPVKAATHKSLRTNGICRISIHAAREGGDCYGGAKTLLGAISIHAAREGGDRMLERRMAQGKISIHAAREGGDCLRTPKRTRASISIHAAREGGDGMHLKLSRLTQHFNPRRP